MEVLGLVRYACQVARWHYLLVNIDMPCTRVHFWGVPSRGTYLIVAPYTTLHSSIFSSLLCSDIDYSLLSVAASGPGGDCIHDAKCHTLSRKYNQ